MNGFIYKYEFPHSVNITEVQATVTLAVLATESLHGESRVRLEARHTFDAKQRSCLIDANGEVGRDLNRLLLGFISREFGADAFSVKRVDAGEFVSAAPAA
jgi:hypothetical protein